MVKNRLSKQRVLIPEGQYVEAFVRAKKNLLALIDDEKTKYRLVPQTGDEPFNKLRGLISNPDAHSKKLKRADKRDPRKLFFVILDSCERALVSLLEGLICVHRAKLELFDIVYMVDGVAVRMIDRKDRDDLSANQERFQNQRARALFNTFNKRDIQYWLEGTNNNEHTLSLFDISTELADTCIRDGMVFRKEDNILSTATTILHEIISAVTYGFAGAEESDKFYIPIESVEGGPGNGASLVLALSSKKNVVPMNCLQFMLAVIPKVSQKMGLQILKKYPTFKTLMEAYHSCKNDKERVNLLATIPYNKRTLGRAVSASVFYHLCAGDEVINDEPIVSLSRAMKKETDTMKKRRTEATVDSLFSGLTDVADVSDMTDELAAEQWINMEKSEVTEELTTKKKERKGKEVKKE